MSEISNKIRPTSDGSFSQDSGLSRKRDLIAQANQSSLIEIFKSYNLNISQYNKKVCCPFSTKHSNGMDSIPSFVFYPDSNSFWCFGCKTGNKPCNFVSAIENINIFKAAEVILSNSYSTYDIQLNNFNLELKLDFSSFIQECLKNNPDDVQIIEEICQSFDQFETNYSSVNDNIQKLFIEKLKNKLKNNLIYGII